MAKKSIGFQFSVLLMAITFFCWLSFSDSVFPYPQYQDIIRALRPILLTLAGALAIPPIIALILQMASKDAENYDDRPYYAVLKGIIHLSFSVLTTLILAVAYAYCYVLLQFVSIKWLSLILTLIIILTIYFIMWGFLKRKFGITYFGFFSYGRR